MVYSTGATRSSKVNLELALLGGLVLVAALALSFAVRASGTCLLVASASLGLVLAGSQAALVQDAGDAYSAYTGSFAIELLDDTDNYGFGEQALARVRADGLPEATVKVRFADAQPMLAGSRLTGQGSFACADFSQDQFSWGEGCSGTLRIREHRFTEGPFPLDALLALRRHAIDAIGDDDERHCLLQAIVCGYRRGIVGTELYARFQTCGLAHLVAVSGAHLVIVVGLFASLLRWLRCPRAVTIGVLVLLMASYYVIAGMPVSALRAIAMSALGLLAYFGKRRSSSLNSVGVGVFAIVALSPPSCVSASFALSALSTIGIVLFSPLINAWLGQTPLDALPAAAEPLSLTLSAGVLSQLFACSLFNQLPLMGPLANIVCAPLFPLVCATGLAASLATVAAPIAGGVLVDAACLVSGALVTAVAALSTIPGASVPVAISSPVALAVSALASLALWAWWPQRVGDVVASAASCALALAIAVVVTADGSDKIVMLDVGQGDAILVQSRGANLLIDTGNEDAKLLEQLGINHVAHLDAVLVTHSDDDHCGSLDALRRAVVVDRVVMAQDMIACGGDAARSLVEEARATAAVQSVGLGDVLHVGAFSAHVVWPKEFTEEGGNADSLCVRLDYDGNDDGRVDAVALMTGDAEREQLAAMMKDGAVGAVDILKVGHHGSRNGMTIDEVKGLSPSIALVSCGENNRYGHPAPEIVAMLDEVGSTVYRTDRDGEVRCKLTCEGVSVSCLS